jgi:two-component system, NarL family, nitrate/nitrite response regulator NarL
MEAAAAAAVSTNERPVRVLIVDDHQLFADALRAILETDGRIEVVGHALDGAEAVELDTALRPDVVLMDISMPVMDGIEATRKIRDARADACVLMLTGSNASLDVDRARAAGAAAYVTKDRIAAELIDTILDVGLRS